LVYLASETWVGALLKKHFLAQFKTVASTASHNKSLQHHSGASRLRWTVFKSRFYGFAAQKYSIKPQLKNCR
jgi:hypothetical protein